MKKLLLSLLYLSLSQISFASPIQLNEDTIQLILATNIKAAQSIDSSQKISSRKLSNEALSSHWEMQGFTTDLAVTADGLIGVLGGHGSSAISILWGKELKGYPKDRLLITLDKNSDHLQSQVESIVQTASNSGKLKAPDQFRKNLETLMQNFSTLIRELNLSTEKQGSEWALSTVKVSFSVNAAGGIFFELPIKGDLGFSLQWHVGDPHFNQHQASDLAVLKSQSLQYPWNSEIKGFVSSLQASLEQAVSEVENKKMISSSLRASEFNVQFGVNAHGEIGISRGGTSVLGTLSFERRENKTGKPPSYSADSFGPIRIIDDVDPQLLATSPKIDPQTLKNGLMKAISVSDFFAKCGDKVSTQNWKMRSLSASFGLGLNGNAGLVSIGGEVAYEINFSRLPQERMALGL